MKNLIFAGIACVVSSLPAAAQNYTQYNSPIPYPSIEHSWLTGQAICIPPYERPFPIRVYTTPPQGPYYNVPPYTVISPY